MPRSQKQTDIDTEVGLPCEINSNIMMSGEARLWGEKNREGKGGAALV